MTAAIVHIPHKHAADQSNIEATKVRADLLERAATSYDRPRHTYLEPVDPSAVQQLDNSRLSVYDFVAKRHSSHQSRGMSSMPPFPTNSVRTTIPRHGTTRSLDRLATAIRHSTGWLTICARTTHWSSSLWKLNPEVNHRGNESGERRAISKSGSSTSVLLAETARNLSLNFCEVLDTQLDSCRPPNH